MTSFYPFILHYNYKANVCGIENSAITISPMAHDDEYQQYWVRVRLQVEVLMLCHQKELSPLALLTK